MFPPRGIIAAVFSVALMAGSSALAGDNKHVGIGGKVIGPDGKPLDGAEIRAMRVDHNNGSVTKTITNSGGTYLFKTLPAGAYSITAYMDGLAMSRANIKTYGVAWAKVDFDFRLETLEGMDHMQKDLPRNFIPE